MMFRALKVFGIFEKGPQRTVSRKSGNLTGHFRVSQFPLYLKNGEDLTTQTSPSVCFLLPSKHVKRPAFLNKRLARIFEIFEKRAPGPKKKTTRKSLTGRIYITGNGQRNCCLTSYGYFFPVKVKGLLGHVILGCLGEIFS